MNLQLSRIQRLGSTQTYKVWLSGNQHCHNIYIYIYIYIFHFTSSNSHSAWEATKWFCAKGDFAVTSNVTWFARTSTIRLDNVGLKTWISVFQAIFASPPSSSPRVSGRHCVSQSSVVRPRLDFGKSFRSCWNVLTISKYGKTFNASKDH